MSFCPGERNTNAAFFLEQSVVNIRSMLTLKYSWCRLMKNFDSSSCHIYIITLEHAEERRKIISQRLKELGLDFEFFSGVDGREINLLKHPNYEPVKRRIFFGRDLSHGEYGCVLAHRNIYQHMVGHQVSRALVLEDDAILTDNLPAVLNALSEVSANWDLVRFLGREKNYRSTRVIGPLKDSGVELSRPLGIPGGAYGYLLNLSAAERLLGLMQKNWLPIDTLHGMVWKTDLETLSVMPSPVLPNDTVPSCIDGLDDSARWNKTAQLDGWQKALYPVTRGLWKLYLNLVIKYTSLKTWKSDQRLGRRLVAD